MAKQLTAISLFSGCGGFDWGAKQAGVEILWANDNDVHAATAYKALFPDAEFVLSDIREVETLKVPKADILIGCYPCTGFSVGARRRWRERNARDLRSNENNFLFREFLRFLDSVQPKYFFVENVRGMSTANTGWFLEQQLNGFRHAGNEGYEVSHELIDASSYGVPQSRKRLFLVGIRRDIGLRFSFPIASFGPGGSAKYRVLKDVIDNPSQFSEWPEGEFFDFRFHGHYLTRNRKRRWDELSYTIVANAHHVPLHPMGEPMLSLGKDKWELQGNKNRRLSWRECVAIQELPMQTEPSGSLEDKYRVVGNSVPPRVSQTLVASVVAFEMGLAHTLEKADNPQHSEAEHDRYRG